MAAPLSAVIFDYGGVISNMRWDVSRALEARHRLPDGCLRQTLWGCAAWQDVERGRGDVEAWRAHAHAEVERIAGRSLPPLHAEWREQMGLILENVAAVRALRPRYRVGLLSNADATLRARLQARMLLEAFDHIVCSAEVGYAKPEPEIYALACQGLGMQPEACVFVDDHEPNVMAAEAAGMRGIHFLVDRGDDLRAQLAAVGIRATSDPAA